MIRRAQYEALNSGGKAKGNIMSSSETKITIISYHNNINQSPTLGRLVGLT